MFAPHRRHQRARAIVADLNFRAKRGSPSTRATQRRKHECRTLFPQAPCRSKEASGFPRHHQGRSAAPVRHPRCTPTPDEDGDGRGPFRSCLSVRVKLRRRGVRRPGHRKLRVTDIHARDHRSRPKIGVKNDGHPSRPWEIDDRTASGPLSVFRGPFVHRTNHVGEPHRRAVKHPAATIAAPPAPRGVPEQTSMWPYPAVGHPDRHRVNGGT